MNATLYYKPSCPPCRWMSALAQALALYQLRRVPVTGEEARALYDRYPGRHGQLVLVSGSRVWFQRQVFAAVPFVVLTAWLERLRRGLRT